MNDIETAINDLRRHTYDVPKSSSELLLGDFLSKIGQDCDIASIDQICINIISSLQIVNDAQLKYGRGHIEQVQIFLLADALARISTECGDFLRTALKESSISTSFAQVFGLEWKVNCAWAAFLAGDIEDLCEHVRVEEFARS